MEQYNSAASTYLHKEDVAHNLSLFAIELLKRGVAHDNSKLKSPEKELFDKYTPILKDLEYGTKEYFENLKLIQPALDHHYANNSHHPQFYENGIDGMNLLDLVEMFCDWQAAVKRTKEGDILKSIEINSKRFAMSEQLVSIIKNSI